MNVRHRIARNLGTAIAGLWLLSAAGIVGTMLLTGCGKIKDLTSSDDDGGADKVTVQPAATSVAPGKALEITATATDKDGAPVKDDTSITFKVNALGSIRPAVALTNAGTATATFTAGAAEGTADITAEADGASGSVTIQVKKGTTAPPPPGGGAGVDMLDPSLVSWDEPAGNVGGWAITSKITSASMTHDRYSIARNPMNNWPAVQLPGWSKPSIGNWWVIAKCSDGKWHGATIEWLGVGATSTAARKWDGHDDIHGCLSNWRPKAGETAYAMQSTHARAGVINNNRQRTNLYRIKMP